VSVPPSRDEVDRLDEDLPLFLQPGPDRPVGPAPPVRAAAAGHTPGEPGLWIFILGDMTLFGAFFLGYLVERRGDREAFAGSARALSGTLGTVNTVVLLTSSLVVVTALRNLRAARPRHAARLIGLAVALAATFAVLKTTEYRTLLVDGHQPAENSFFTYYFVLTGVHLLHLVVGAALLVALLVRTRRRPPHGGGLRFAEGVACYWHMVDLLWIALFPLLYLVAIS
jgi:nitric oxide reductase NorE protein